MAVNTTYYLNAADLSLATAVYLDSSLSLIAPDGFYGDGVISRQQSSGILLAANPCPACATPCGGTINANGNQGVFLLNLDAGGTTSDVGAIIVTFDPSSVPDGIRATYDGNIYNKLSSPLDGVHQSTDPNAFTVVGDSGNDCGLEGNTTNFPTIDEYRYDGTGFVATGNTQNITVNPGDVSLSSIQPGDCVMVIPKPNATPNIVNLEFLGPCGGTVWTLDIACPALLPAFSSTDVRVDFNIPCGEELTQTYYFAKVHTAADSYVGLYDYVFEDAYGALPLADGFYMTDNVAVPNKVLQVVNGVVIKLSECV